MNADGVEISERLNVLPLAVYRQRTELPLSLEMELHRGDVITFYGPEFAIDSLVRLTDRTGRILAWNDDREGGGRTGTVTHDERRHEPLSEASPRLLVGTRHG